jgi:hypothetical protein
LERLELLFSVTIASRLAAFYSFLKEILLGVRMPTQKLYRLPTTVIPERYEIRLTPDLAAATFAGEERVFLQVREPVRQFVFIG